MTACPGTPLASSARLTLTPLPPGSSRAVAARMTEPRLRSSISIDRSRLGLSVSVMIMTMPRRGPMPRRSCPAHPEAGLLELAAEFGVQAAVGDEQVHIGQFPEPGQVVVSDLRVVGQDDGTASRPDHRAFHRRLGRIRRGQAPL